MSSLVLSSRMRGYWHARPSWAIPVAIAVGLHALLLAVPVRLKPLSSSLLPSLSSRGALLDLGERLRLAAPRSKALSPQGLQLPVANEWPPAAPNLQRLSVPELPPVEMVDASHHEDLEAQLITVQPIAPSADREQSSSVVLSPGTKPSRPSLESILQSIAKEDNSFELLSWQPSQIDAEDQERWNDQLRILEFAPSWYLKVWQNVDLQLSFPEQLSWPVEAPFVFRFELWS